MCVYFYPTGEHDNQCYLVNEFCPSDGKFRKQGGGGGDDGGDIVVKVFRAPNAAPTCTAYTLFMANGN